MAKSNRFTLQPASAVVGLGTTDLVIARTNVAMRSNNLFTQAAVLYVQTTSAQGTSETLNIEVFNQVLDTGEFSVGSFAAVTSNTTVVLTVGSNFAGYGNTSEAPLIAPFLFRQVVTGTASPQFNVEIEIQWLSSGQLVS